LSNNAAPTTEASADQNPTETDSWLGNQARMFEPLKELSARLKRSLIAYVIALVLVSSLPNPLQPLGGPYSIYGYNFLIFALIRDAEATIGPNFKFFAQSPTDPVFAFMNLSMVLALLVSLPYIFHEIYGFISPGLYLREKRAVRKYVLPFATLLTIGGIFGLLIVFPLVMRILLMFYAPLGVQNLISLDDFVNLLMLIPLLTGISFTFPVFLIPLVELRIISAKQLSSARKWVYVGVALGVSIANPDPTDISSIPIVLPMLILYEITIFIAKRVEKKRERKMEQTEVLTPHTAF
jgi:sec-independent protein translocase protein TatC